MARGRCASDVQRLGACLTCLPPVSLLCVCASVRHTPPSTTSNQPPPAAFGNFTYRVPRTGASYVLQTRPMSFADAARSCQANGGQLASLGSQLEQADLEAYYIGGRRGRGLTASSLATTVLSGAGRCAVLTPLSLPRACAPTGQNYLLPAFHKWYWLGLQSTVGSWPLFTWVDLSNSSYANWGRCGALVNPQACRGPARWLHRSSG